MSEPIQAAAAPQAQTTGNGRVPGGQFAMGNRGGPGNPFARQVAALRKTLLDCVTPQDIKTIAAKLLELAKSGDLAAIKLLLAYAIGKPQPAVQPDNLDVEEWEHLKSTAWLMKDLPKMLGPGVELPLEAARAVRPGMANDIARLFAKGLKLGKIPDDVDDQPPSTNGVNRPQPPSTNGHKQASANGGKRRLEHGKLVPA